jgi:hypothetical protein
MSTNDPKVAKQITKKSKLVPSSDQNTSTIVGSIGETNLQHYKKSWFIKRPTWKKCPHWPKGMSILTKGLDMRNTCYI